MISWALPRQAQITQKKKGHACIVRVLPRCSQEQLQPGARRNCAICTGVFACVCVCVCVCVSDCVCVIVCLHTHTYTNTHIHVCKYVCVCVCIYVYAYDVCVSVGEGGVSRAHTRTPGCPGGKKVQSRRRRIQPTLRCRFRAR